MLNRDELCQRLGCSSAQITAWLKRGLPSTGAGKTRRFEPGAVATWLQSQGLAEPVAAADGAVTPAGAVGALWLAALRGDRGAIRTLVGEVKLASLKEVAAAFDVSPNTIKQGWRKAGDMPGTEGAWPLAEILLWKWEREGGGGTDGNRESGSGNQGTAGAAPRYTPLDRKRDADARKAEADAAAKELKCAQLAGNLCYRDDVEREWAQQISVTRHTLARIAAELEPRLPRDQADEIKAEIEAEVEKALAILAEGEEGIGNRE